jgi:hypothetical protein
MKQLGSPAWRRGRARPNFCWASTRVHIRFNPEETSFVLQQRHCQEHSATNFFTFQQSLPFTALVRDSVLKTLRITLYSYFLSNSPRVVLGSLKSTGSFEMKFLYLRVWMTLSLMSKTTVEWTIHFRGPYINWELRWRETGRYIIIL